MPTSRASAATRTDDVVMLGDIVLALMSGTNISSEPQLKHLKQLREAKVKVLLIRIDMPGTPGHRDYNDKTLAGP